MITFTAIAVLSSALSGLPEGADAALSPPPLVEAVAAPVVPTASSGALPMFGAMLDVGVPDGAGASLLVRPLRWLRLEGGAIHNAVSPGVRLGATWVPIRFAIMPTLTVEAGHYFDGNANGIVQKVSQNPSFSSGFLNSVSYDFANAHLGLELGSARRFVFFLHGGYSYLSVHIKSFSDGLRQAADTSWTASPLTAHATGVSAKLGFILFLG